jgi:hypothetical protein
MAYHIQAAPGFLGIPAIPMIDAYLESAHDSPLTDEWLQTLGLAPDRGYTARQLLKFSTSLIRQNCVLNERTTHRGPEWIAPEDVAEWVIDRSGDDIQTECLLWTASRDVPHYFLRRLGTSEVMCVPGVPMLECYLRTGHDVPISSQWRERLFGAPGSSHELIASMVKGYKVCDRNPKWATIGKM